MRESFMFFLLMPSRVTVNLAVFFPGFISHFHASREYYTRPQTSAQVYTEKVERRVRMRHVAVWTLTKLLGGTHDELIHTGRLRSVSVRSRGDEAVNAEVAPPHPDTHAIEGKLPLEY